MRAESGLKRASSGGGVRLTGMAYSSATPSHRARHTSEKSGWLVWIREIAVILVFALVISTLLRLFVVQVFSIPSESMVPTLQVGDRILVNRLPWAKVDRGDVVVFEDTLEWMEETPPGEGSVLRPVAEFLGIIPADGRQIIVKRVIGVGGDTVECCTAEGYLSVNGVPIKETYVEDPGAPAAEEFSITVPEGHYWVMGDNRYASADSLRHYQVGEDPYISEDALIGPVKWVVWPFKNWSSVSQRETFLEVGG